MFPAHETAHATSDIRINDINSSAAVIRNLYLVGMPGAGKSTIGKAIARILGLTFCDADEELVRLTGVSIATIFELEGEAGFRVRETQALKGIAAQSGLVVATGGGVILREANRALLQASGTVVYLQTGLADLRARTRRDTKRPLLQNADPERTLETMLETREPLYREVASLTFASNRSNPKRLADAIARAVVEKGLFPKPAEDVPPLNAMSATNSP